MFAAAATFAQMVFDSARQVALWLATKVFVLAILTIVLPFVLRGVLIWFFKFLQTYGSSIFSFFQESISGVVQQAGIETHLELTSVGGYLALQTGLIDYCSIIFTGWGLYWFVVIYPKLLFHRV